jgi:DNA primase
MAMYTRESRERVRDAVDFVEVVSARSELRRAGPARYEGLCPFHDERTPSFGIDPAQKVYHCFGCQASGDVFTFVQETEGVDFKEALELLAERYGVELEREQEDPDQARRRRRRERLLELLARTCAYYERCLWDSREGARAREQLAERGLQEEMLREFGVGYAPDSYERVLGASRAHGYSEEELCATGLAQRSQTGRAYDRFRGRIMFPLSDMRGRVLGFGARATAAEQQPKYLNTADNDVYHKGRYLYGAHLARAPAARAGKVIVCEGYTDVIALHQAGMRHAVGLMGTALTEDQMGELARMAQTVVLALDADSAGQEAMLRAAGLAARRGLALRVVELPEGTDPADLVRRGGAAAIEDALGRAVPFARFRVERALASGDHSSPEGKDEMLEQLRPVFAALPASALRMELTRLVSSSLALPDGLAETLLSRPGGRAGAGRRSGASRARKAPAATPANRAVARSAEAHGALARGERTERAFLALCMAAPAKGQEALAAIDVQAHFTSELLRRAAGHLRAHLREPLGAEAIAAGSLDEDPQLKALLAELVVDAGREPANPAMLQAQRLQLELARIERAIQVARVPAEGPARTSEPPGAPGAAESGAAAPGAGISELATRRMKVLREFDQALRELEESGDRGG